MRRIFAARFILVPALLIAGTLPASADSASPAQSMTHMKSAPGIAKTLAGAGVVLYAQGGATAGVMGDSIADAKGQVVFHIPITANKAGVQHTGSNIVLFNTTNNKQVQLRNPVIDLTKGVVTAVVPQVGTEAITVLNISNLATLKPKSSTDRAAGVRSRTFAGASLNFAPSIASTVATLLGLPGGALPDGALFATADVTLKKRVR